jgi:hypothetical protein
MSDLELAKLYTVSEPLDRPVSELTQGETAVNIQFNPTTLKVSLANSLKENENSDSNSAAQFIEKSSSNLTVELVFDTTDSYLVPDPGNSENNIDLKDTDVRLLTRQIAVNFMASDSVGDDSVEPQRCLFAWGAFAFVGIMESMEETLEFFSPEGIPLRATVALKLAESRFQFRTEEAEAAERDTPTLSNATNSVAEANSASDKDEKDWRDTAMYNGIESPRAPGGGSLSVPSAAAMASLKASASIGVGAGAGISGGFSAGIGAGTGIGIGGGLSAGIGVGIGAGVSAGISAGAGAGISGGLGASVGGGIGGGLSGGIGGGLSSSMDISSSLGGGLSASTNISPPAFSFGASSSLGTSIPGAFSADISSGGGISAGSIVTGGVILRDGAVAPGGAVSIGSVSSSSAAKSSSSITFGSAAATVTASVGFD